MGKLPSGERKYNLQRLLSVHREILRRHALGQKSVTIAEELNISAATVSYTINNPLAQEVLSGIQEGADASVVNVGERIQEIAIDAVEVLDEMIANAGVPPAIRLRAAVDVLDRAGHGAVKKIEGRVAHGIFTAEEIAQMREQAKTAAKEVRAQEAHYEVVQEAT